jgi:hypothetical protein
MQYRRETTDPQDEVFDVLTQAGELTGERAARWLVHQNGLWHPAFHLCIACGLPRKVSACSSSVGVSPRTPCRGAWT